MAYPELLIPTRCWQTNFWRKRGQIKVVWPLSIFEKILACPGWTPEVWLWRWQSVDYCCWCNIPWVCWSLYLFPATRYRTHMLHYSLLSCQTRSQANFVGGSHGATSVLLAVLLCSLYITGYHGEKRRRTFTSCGNSKTPVVLSPDPRGNPQSFCRPHFARFC